MNREQMIAKIREQSGYSKKWMESLDSMTTPQVHAIYFRLLKRGIIK